MTVNYFDYQAGLISDISAGGVRVPFAKNSGPAFYIKEDGKQSPVALKFNGEAYTATQNGIYFEIKHTENTDCLSLTATLHNLTEQDFSPEAIGLKLGVDSYMVEYPQWNDVFFPTFLRCEKSHFWGYMMSPLGKILAVTTNGPIAAWELDYNTISYGKYTDGGHRIYTANLLLFCRGRVPERHPQHLNTLKAGQKYSVTVCLAPLDGLSQFENCIHNIFNLPVIKFDKYCVPSGEKVKLQVLSNSDYTVQITTPRGKILKTDEFTADEYGVYTADVLTADGKAAGASAYCRHDYGWYLKAARKNAVEKPQKATTHTESWYGWFSAFLARKHYPDAALDSAAFQNFCEVAPLMYDMEKGEARVIPERIQNVACFIGVLVDLYECDPENNLIYLDYADNLTRQLTSRQGKDGAYRNHGEHYTSVIYIAKSMLELALCEKTLADKNPKFSERCKQHYASAKAAVDDLCRLGEKIGTEGEHTLEDGMISCTALQLAFFALTLPEEKRAPYINQAEHLIEIHRCLEQQYVPDCRMRGATLRFWEAQYDVMVKSNLLNSPHGWTAWKNYATYYLYLLTGKEEYLIDTVNTVGSCLQLIDENENLRWSFAVDPYISADMLVPDTFSPVLDGYRSSEKLTTPAYRGKFERRILGEQYVDMVSDWYRTGKENLMTGGYAHCALVLPDEVLEVDNQGGACDNDVHENFKCLEETLLKKAFVVVHGDGRVHPYNCKAKLNGDTLYIIKTEECEFLHINTAVPLTAKIDNKSFTSPKGMTMFRI